MTRRQPTSPADLNAVLTRIAERAERHRAEREAERYASQVLAVAVEMAGEEG